MSKLEVSEKEMVEALKRYWPHKGDMLIDTKIYLAIRSRVLERGTWNKWWPTVENINALPESLRKYIHDLETVCDPAGMVQEIAILREYKAALERLTEDHSRLKKVMEEWQESASVALKYADPDSLRGLAERVRDFDIEGKEVSK